MKRKLFTAFVMIGAISLTACQEDTAMDELIQDTELTNPDRTGDNDPGDGDIDPTKENLT